MRTWPTALAENPNPVAFCKTRTGPNNGMPPKGPSAIAEDERGRRVDPVRAPDVDAVENLAGDGGSGNVAVVRRAGGGLVPLVPVSGSDPYMASGLGWQEVIWNVPRAARRVGV